MYGTNSNYIIFSGNKTTEFDASNNILVNNNSKNKMHFQHNLEEDIYVSESPTYGRDVKSFKNTCQTKSHGFIYKLQHGFRNKKHSLIEKAYNAAEYCKIGKNFSSKTAATVACGLFMASVPCFKVSGKAGKILKNTVKTIKCDIKPQIDTDIARRAAERITDDPRLQEALIRISKKEGIIIRKKEDAIPILKKQFQALKDKKNLVILDINPQENNGMPKSNNLISEWFTEANNLSSEQLITLLKSEFRQEYLKAQDICEAWKQGTSMHKQLQKKVQKLQSKPQNNSISLKDARKIINDCKSKSQEEILSLYKEDEIAQAIAKINTSIIMPFKNNGGYAGALAEQLKEVIAKSKGETVTIVIPDDCSLSGSSILCDTIKILDKLFKNNTIESKIDVIFSPMILGDKAKKVITQFGSADFKIDENYLRKVNAIRLNGEESFKDARNAFNRVKNLNNVEIKISDESIRAVHFTETETFKQIGKEDPVLQKKLLYLMQGPIDTGNKALFGGFEECGVMVVTPTREFVIDGKKYAGKIPTNSVGYMEILGQECGVLNDALETETKGLFTKGTGRNYTRYCEWEGIKKPSKKSDRIPIFVKDGIVYKRAA